MSEFNPSSSGVSPESCVSAGNGGGQSPGATDEAALSPAQQKALEFLVAGAPVTKAAEAAGVHRSTVHRWVNDDEPFRAALARTQRVTRETLHAQLLAMGEQAIVKVRSRLEVDPFLALRLLEKLGVFRGDLLVQHLSRQATKAAGAGNDEKHSQERS